MSAPRIAVTHLGPGSAARRPIEIVERKGLGHPDTICDALAENLSRALCEAYLERFGTVLHHNVDKALLVGGLARPAFGGGEIVAPIDIHLAGRATRRFRDQVIDVDDIARSATRRWFADHLPRLPLEHVQVQAHLQPTSPDLAELFVRTQGAGTVLANDTSFGVGYAPLDALERTVLAAESALHDAVARAERPWIGDDVKVMGVRDGEDIALTVACAFVDRHVASLDDYLAKKADLAAHVSAYAAAEVGRPVDVVVNSADGETPESVYLTVTGLSAEGGDDGQVGRGNRVNGLITPFRPMSLEAAAGKNPVSHVGKLYNVAATRIAGAIATEIEDVEEAQCTLLSRIGQPIGEPWAIEIALRLTGAGADAVDEVDARVAAIARRHLANIGEQWRDIVSGRVALW